MTYMKSGSPFLYDEDSGDIVGVKDADGGESFFGRLSTDANGNTVLAGADGPYQLPVNVSATINPAMTTAQINTVIAAVVADGGGIVVAAPGLYLLDNVSATGCLVLGDNITLFGAGKATVFKVADDTAVGVHAIAFSNATGVECAYFSIDGNRARNEGAYDGEDDVIGGAATVDAYLHHLWIYEGGDCGVDLDNATNPRVENCYIYDCNGNGIHLAGASGCTNASVVDNYIKNCAHARNAAGLANPAGIDAFGNNSLIERNRVIDCYKGIIIGVVSGSSRSMVRGNHITSPSANMNQGVVGDANTFVIANVITGATSSGVSSCGYVSQNIIDGGAQNVNCTASGARVLDNVLTGATNQSVMINSAGITYGRIAGNQMTRNGTKINCNAGAGVVIDENNFFGTGTAVAGTAVASMDVRVNP